MIDERLYDRLEELVFLIWDNEKDYSEDGTQKKIGDLFKNKHRVYSLDDLENILRKYDNYQEYIFFIHLAHNNENEGYRTFIEQKIIKKYPKLKYYCISRIDRSEIYSKGEKLNVYNWEGYREEIDKTFIAQTVSEMRGEEVSIANNIIKSNNIEGKFSQFDYAIITALEEDEMEKILTIIERDGKIENSKHLIEYGHIKGFEHKKVIYASQQATGMIDAAILATELLHYKPKYLIMAGVLGGKPKKTNTGDVVVATRTFTVDKGKNDKLGFHREIESSSNENACITSLKRIKKDIKDYLRTEDNTRDSKIDIHFGPIGCVRQVIDLEDFFQDSITKVDRKAIALEMESYAVSRSCELVNEGQTKALIIKSVMDNTIDKDDDGKPYASWSSTMFVKYILENDII